MVKVIKESRPTYSVSVDTTKSITKPVVIKRAGKRIAAIVPINEYDQFVSWRKQQHPTRKRVSKESWLEKQNKIMAHE